MEPGSAVAVLASISGSAAAADKDKDKNKKGAPNTKAAAKNSAWVQVCERAGGLLNNIEFPLFHIQHSQQFVFERRAGAKVLKGSCCTGINDQERVVSIAAAPVVV